MCNYIVTGQGDQTIDLPVERVNPVVEMMGSGSSIQGVACTATLQSLHVPISVSLAATCWPTSRKKNIQDFF